MEMMRGRIHAHWRFWSFISSFAVVFLLGGAEASWGWQTLSVIIMMCAIAFTTRAKAFRVFFNSPPALRVGVVLLSVSVLLQLIPLPFDLWTSMPGQRPREDVIRTFLTSETWLPISQVPMWTVYTALMLFGSLAAVAVMVDMTTREFDLTSYTIVALVFLSITVGVLQFASNGVMFKFHAIADDGALLGFFANKNHAASVIAMSIPIMHAVVATTRQSKRNNAVSALYTIIALLAVIATNSRAGLGLAIMSATITHIDQLWRAPWKLRLGAAGLGVAIVVVILYSQTFQIVADRAGQIGVDGRWAILERSMPLVQSFWLTGSGWGSYVTIYRTRELLEWLDPTYINNAHNDLLQIAIEGGILACGALVAAVFALMKLTVVIWRDGSGASRRFAMAGTVAIVIVVIHSGVDYPLRRPAVLLIVLYALAAVLRGYHHATTRVNEHGANGGSDGKSSWNDLAAPQSATVHA